ncbi:hypothetical protein ACNOYE_20985 [Nannocystaceae bacterium ST9]
MTKQREPNRPTLPARAITENRPRSSSLTPPRYGIDVVDFAARPDPRWVGGATTGRFPFGERLQAETGGAVEPHAIPSVVVPGLPDRGVSVAGKVALRPDAPIEVARHELAHSLGADEATAHRAEQNPRVLAGLSKSARPIDGWAIGFEFQTAGAKNPKTYSRGIVPLARGASESVSDYRARGARLPKNYTAWRKEAISDTYDRDGYVIKTDDCDMEVETSAVDETPRGRERLVAVMEAMESEMAIIAENGFNENNEVENVVTLNSNKTHGIAHGNRDFTGKPQATAGFKLDQISNLIKKIVAREGTYGWGDYWGVRTAREPKRGLGLIHDLNRRVGDLSQLSPNVVSLLHLLASYSIYGDAFHHPTKYLKNIANTLMIRNNLGKIFTDYLSGSEREELRTLLADETGQATVARLFGADDFGALRARKILRSGVAASYGIGAQVNQLADLTVGKVFDDLLQGTDAIHAKAPDQSIGKIADDASKFPGQLDPFDIGINEANERRRGVLVEIRGLGEREPYTRWKDIALLMFDLAAELNEAKPARPEFRPRQPAQPARARPVPRAARVDAAPAVEVNHHVEFDGRKGRVIKVLGEGRIRVNRSNHVMDLAWDGGKWAEIPV